jgi:hypothetical protein
MDIQNNIKPATLQEAFDISNSTNIIGKNDDGLELRHIVKKPIRDIFLDDDFKDAEVFYPSRINRIDKYELDIKTKPEPKEPVQAF